MTDNYKLSMSAIYELRRIKNSNDKHLTKALYIYSQNIDPLLRTDTREIIYWLDNYNNTYKDRFFLLGLFLNNELIGYSQLAHFIDEKMIFIDYIVIDQNFRKNNTFYEFVEQIREYLYQEGFDFNFVVGEVGYFIDNKEPTEQSKMLIRLLKMSGFGVVKSRYFQPMLGKNNFESEVLTVLMIYIPNDVKKIKKETFLLIIETIYYRHYKRWYDKFFTETEQSNYNNRLNNLFALISSDVKKKSYIEINGYANLYTSIDKRIAKRSYNKVAKLVTIISLFVLFSLIVAFIVLYLKKSFGVTEQTIALISISALVLLIIVLRIFFSSKDLSLSEIVEETTNTIK